MSKAIAELACENGLAL